MIERRRGCVCIARVRELFEKRTLFGLGSALLSENGLRPFPDRQAANDAKRELRARPGVLSVCVRGICIEWASRSEENLLFAHERNIIVVGRNQRDSRSRLDLIGRAVATVPPHLENGCHLELNGSLPFICLDDALAFCKAYARDRDLVGTVGCFRWLD